MIEASSSQVPCTLPQSLETSNENKYHSVSTNDQKPRTESLRCLQSTTNSALPTSSYDDTTFMVILYEVMTKFSVWEVLSLKIHN